MLTTRSLNSLDRMITLNRAIDQAFGNGSFAQARAWLPAIDIVEKKDAYVLYAELPGLDASQVNIDFEKNVLKISGTKKHAFEPSADELRVHSAERATGSFERSIRLPDYVDGAKIDAAFTNGLLTITVPKAQAAQPRKIEIR